MASIEQTATAIASIIDDLANGTITESAAAVLLVDALTGYFPVSQIQDLTDKIIAMIGRMDGTLILSRPPLANEGTIGSVTIDIANKQLYGPKTSSTVDPWGSPQPLIGAQGPAGTITSATVTTGAAGSQAAIVLGGTPSARTLAFTIPRGDKGNTGLTPSLTIGTVTTGAPGSAAAANFTGTTDNPILSLTIPRGDVGPVGVTPNVSVAIVMVANGEPATVTRSGPDAAPLLTFSIPSPLDGEDGREVEFNVSATHIQTRYSGDTVWVDLIAVADLKGPKGDRGKAFDPDATGNTLADRDAYDNEADGFTFLNTTTGLVYYRQGAAGNWSDGVAIGAAQSDILDALAALDASTGVLVQTGDATFAKLSIGASSDTNILDRISADGRYRRSSQAVPLADITGLVTALNDKADAAAVIAALGNKEDTSNKGQANGYAALGSDGKVPSGQLPATSASFDPAVALAAFDAA